MSDRVRLASAHPHRSYLRYLGVAVAVLVPLLVTLDRFRRPYGDKFMFPNLGGSSDLWLPYNGARALIAGIDPYMPTLPPALRDPSGWPMGYPPTMLLLYVPLVLVTHSDIESACQIFYWLNIVALAALTLVVWELARSLRRERWRDSLGTLLLVAMPICLCSATMFAVDRSQSEIINAALCWGGILLFTRKRFASAMALVTLAAAIKGYAAILALGMLLSIPTRKDFLRSTLAAGLVSLAVTVPVANRLQSGFSAMLARGEFSFIPVWFNHSFKATFYHLTPEGCGSARRYLLIFTAAVSALAGWRLRLAMRSASSGAMSLRAVLYAAAALGFMVGMPVYSGPYNYLLVLPALLLLATSWDSFAGMLRLRLAVAWPLGISTAVALALALEMRWLGSEVSLAGIALVYLVLLAGGLSVIPARWVTSKSAQ